MFAAALILAASAVLLGAVVLNLAREGREKSIPRNQAYGIRTKETKKSDEACAVAHCSAAPLLKSTGTVTLLVAGISIVLWGLAIPFEQVGPYAFGVGAIAYLVLIIGLLIATRRANAAARQVP